MSVTARIPRSEPYRYVGPRDAETVIMSRVDDHIGAGWHVAGCAGERWSGALMAMMRFSRIFRGRVALQADTVTGKTQGCAVRFMTVAAGNTGREHFTLFERSVIVDFILHLPVRIIKPAAKGRDNVRVGQPLSGSPIFRERATARVAKSAGLDLLAQGGGRRVAGCVSLARVDCPCDIFALIEADHETLGWVFLLASD
jgi:hypothetical protein